MLSKTDMSVLKGKWQEAFVGNMNTSDIQLHQYPWHVFSYGLIPCLSEEYADRAFQNQRKANVFVFFGDEEDVYLIEDLSISPLNEFEEFMNVYLKQFMDVYLTDEHFKWIHVITHEGLGPYFFMFS